MQADTRGEELGHLGYSWGIITRLTVSSKLLWVFYMLFLFCN